MRKIFFLRIILLITLSTVLTFPSYGQVLHNSNSKGSDTMVIINNFNVPKKKKPEYKYELKLNPLLLLSGELPIYMEFKVTKKLSIEAGVGPTLGDPTYYLFSPASSPIDFLDSSDKALLGITLKAALRFYPQGFGFPEGIFFGPEFRYKSYNYSIFYADFTPAHAIDSFHYQRNYTDVLLTFGYQGPIAEGFYIEGYSGIGFRFKRGQYIVSRQDANGYRKYVPLPRKENTLLFSAGVKIGYAF